MVAKIAQYRQEHPSLTLAEIGEVFNVSRQYVHKGLKQTATPTIRAKK